jgi:Protein of unknown function (DUF2934)
MNYPIIVRDQPFEPILEHEIRLRAYDLFLRRGEVDGQALDDWLHAECEVVRERQPYKSWKPS